MKLVVLSDLHAHTWSAFAQGEGRNNSRLIRSLEVLDASLSRAGEDGIPWIFAGDIVHTAGYALNPVLAGLLFVLEAYPYVPKYVVWGNHDARGVGGRIVLEETALAAFTHLDNFTVLMPGVGAEVDGGLIVGAGYQPTPELILEDIDKLPAAEVGVFHQTVLNTETPTGHRLGEGIPAAVLEKKFGLSIVGHVHHPQAMGRADRVLIPGSPEHQNFGDKGEHGWWVVDTESLDLEFIPGGSPEFRTVDSPADVEEDGHFYRVLNAGGGNLPEHATAVAPEPTHVKERDLLRDVSELQEVLEVWLRENPPEEPEDIEHDYDCAMGLGGPCDCPAGIEAGRYLTTGLELLTAQDPVRLRPARLFHLRLENFGSFAREAYFIEDGVWLVTGAGRHYPSNGAGKTTLIGEAPFWLLFGKTTKGQAADEVIRWGENSCEVEGWIKFEDETYLRVVRSRGPSGHTLQVEEHELFQSGDPEEVWEAASVNEMTSRLQERLGLTPEIYQNLCYFSQQNLLLFASATDGERKSILADLLGLSGYQNASSAAGSKAQDAERLAEQVAALLESRQEDLDGFLERRREEQDMADGFEEDRRVRLDEAEERLTVLEKDPTVAELQEQRDRIVTRIEEHTEARVRATRRRFQDYVTRERERLLAQGKTRVEAAEESLTEAEQALIDEYGSLARARALVDKRGKVEARLTELRAVDPNLVDELAEAKKADRTATGRKLALTHSIHQARKDREEAEAALANGTCPTCQQPVDADQVSTALDPYTERIEKYQTQLTAVQTEAEEAERLVEEVAEKIRERGRLADTTQELLDRIKDAQTKLQVYDLQLEQVENRRSQLESLGTEARRRAEEEIAREVQEVERRGRNRVRRVTAYVEEIAKLHAQEMKAVQEQVNQIRGEVNPYMRVVASLDDDIKKVRGRIEGNVRTVRTNRQEAAIYRYWQKGFSRQGIQSLLMEELASVFNRARATIFPILTQGIYDVQFSTLSTTRAGELRERTEFRVWEQGEEVPYDSLSGGERRRIDVGILLTLAVAVSKWMGVRGVLGTLILDEVLSFTDASGSEGLLEALLEIRETVPTLYVVTHDTHLQSMFPNVLRVAQEDGASVIA